MFFRGRPGVEEEVEILSQLIPLAKAMFQPTTRRATRRLVRKSIRRPPASPSTRRCPTGSTT